MDTIKCTNSPLIIHLENPETEGLLELIDVITYEDLEDFLKRGSSNVTEEKVEEVWNILDDLHRTLIDHAEKEELQYA